MIWDIRYVCTWLSGSTLYVCMYVRTKEWAIDGLILSGKHFLGESSSQIGQAPSTWQNQPPISHSLALRVATYLPSRPTQSPMIECRLLPCYPKQWLVAELLSQTWHNVWVTSAVLSICAFCGCACSIEMHTSRWESSMSGVRKVFSLKFEPGKKRAVITRQATCFNYQIVSQDSEMNTNIWSFFNLMDLHKLFPIQRYPNS
jgi:hypothetical protein